METIQPAKKKWGQLLMNGSKNYDWHFIIPLFFPAAAAEIVNYILQRLIT